MKKSILYKLLPIFIYTKSGEKEAHSHMNYPYKSNLKFHKLFPIGFLCLFLFNQVSAQSPNFVIIVVDDQGWTGSSVQMDADIPGSKSDFYLTPEMESMSQAGLTFSQGYAPAPKCAPSRASILTGRTTARNNFTSTDNDIATGKIPAPLFKNFQNNKIINDLARNTFYIYSRIQV